MAAAKNGLTFNLIIGSPPSLEFRSVRELDVDPVYQRSTDNDGSQRLIKRIAMRWDWGLCQPLTVARRTDGKLYVVDGQHRWEAARLRGDIPHLPCVIVNYLDEAQEAGAFVELNQRRKALNALELFKAALAAGKEEAHAIAQALSTAGLTLAPHTNYTVWKPGMVSNIGGIQVAYRLYGAGRLTEALTVMALAFEGEVLRYAGSIFPGIVAVCGDHNYERDCLVKVLRNYGQNWWARAGAAAAIDEGRRDKGMAKVVREKYQLLPGKAPPAAPAHTIAIGENQIGWCDQCDRRVGYDRVKNCADKFCALKQPAGATGKISA